MENKLYSLLNNLLNPKKFPVALSIAILLTLPTMLELFLIIYFLKGVYTLNMILTLEALSVLIGYLYVFLLMRIRIRHSLSKYKEKRICRLVGSLPAFLYLLSPGLISFFLGIFLMLPFISSYIGHKIIRVSNIDPSIIHTLLELNYSK